MPHTHGITLFRITSKILVHTSAYNSMSVTSLLKKLTELLTEVLSKPQAGSANSIPSKFNRSSRNFRTNQRIVCVCMHTSIRALDTGLAAWNHKGINFNPKHNFHCLFVLHVLL